MKYTFQTEDHDLAFAIHGLTRMAEDEVYDPRTVEAVILAFRHATGSHQFTFAPRALPDMLALRSAVGELVDDLDRLIGDMLVADDPGPLDPKALAFGEQLAERLSQMGAADERRPLADEEPV